MSKRNPEYDFLWCPGCGDFGVRRAIEMALRERMIETELPAENNVIVAGIGCSGNLVHLVEGPQPFGFHGVHGRTLPVAMGVKMSRPELNVLTVAGDGDFLSIGGEHIGPQAHRNLNICSVVLDNSVYGLTKGQASPTTDPGSVTATTPYGKIEDRVNPFELYLTHGVSFIASAYSSRVKEMTQLIIQGMKHPGFAIVHVTSPCVTYNDTHDLMKGNPKTGTAGKAFAIPDDYDPTNKAAAYEMARSSGVPVGIIYRDPNSVPLEERIRKVNEKVKPKAVRELLEAYKI